jgi:hypothetical protein
MMKMGVPALAAAEGADPRLFLLLALTLALKLGRLPGGALDVASVMYTLYSIISYHGHLKVVQGEEVLNTHLPPSKCLF